MIKKRFFLIPLVFFLLISQLWAESEKNKLLQIPQGKLVIKFFEAFNSGDPEIIREFIKKNYSQSNLKRNPVDQELLFFQLFSR